MQSTDDKKLPLAKMVRRPLSRRTVSKKDFTLPRPYRRQLFSEEPEKLTRLQLSLLGFSGVMVSTLFGVLALFAHESERSPDGKLIVAAARLEQVEHAEQAEAQHTAFITQPAEPAAPVQPAELVKTTEPAQPAQPAQPEPQTPPPARVAQLLAPVKAKPANGTPGIRKKPFQHPRIIAALLGRDSKLKPLRLAPAAFAAARAPDADVALITAILLLTPAPVPVAAPAVSLELTGHGHLACLETISKKSHCLDSHRENP